MSGRAFYHAGHFDGCMIYDGGKVQSDTLYLCVRPDGAPSSWRNGMAIGLEAAPADLPASCCYLHARERNARKRRRPAEARLIALANAVHAAIAKLDRWAIATERACSEAPDFSALLNLCERELGFVSILVNKNLRYLAVSDGFAERNPWFNRTDTSMDTEMINQLTADEAFMDAINQSAPFYYHYVEGDGSDSACFNIIVEGRYEARLIMQATSGREEPGLLDVAAYLGERITDLFRRYADGSDDASENPRFKEALRTLMKGGTLRPEELREHLAIRGWALGHTLQVTAFMFMEPESATVTQRYYEDRIAHLFEGCAEINADGLIYCIRNLSIERTARTLAQQELVLFLRENLCYAGTSRAFDDVRELHAHAQEARAALELGMASGSMQWHFDFGDHVLRYICDRASRDLGGAALLHPAFEALRAYDEEHGTELLETARYFMECRYNVTHAAARLHIHRTSMLARLERIDAVASIDWDSWDDRVHLALSFMLAT